MTKLRGKTYWLIGASEGIGAALARELDRQGVQLILSARSADALAALAAELRGDAQVIPCDVADPRSVEDAFQRVGAMDGLVYLAGLYTPMPADAWDTADISAMCDVNYLGACRVLGHVVPRFAARNSGHIVFIGSLAGFSGLPGAIGYGASKSALMHLAENLQADLAGSGIKIQTINPGFVDTRLTRKNRFKMPFIMTAPRAARRIASAMMRHRRSISFPLPMALYFKGRAILRLLTA